MRKKLLVITVGTVAAAVGQVIQKQIEVHPSNLQLMVRYIDTSFLPNRYGNLRNGEWFQMNIGQRYIEALYKRSDDFPRFKAMLFPTLLPGTAASGGGGIRYNGAGALEVQRERLERWLRGSMDELAMTGTDETSISIVLVVSAVGATGSGSLERLLEVIVDAAHDAHIRSSALSIIHCDTYILQPTREVSSIGLANTLALYAELAASAFNPRREYYGRKILVGGDDTSVTLSSLQHLIESAATLIRLSTDPISLLPAEFGEREVDHHVLHELDPITNLPSHLSTATAVTISLGNLVNHIIEREVALLINSLVFGESANGSSNMLFSRFSRAIAGETPHAQYKRLLDYLTETIGVSQMRSRLDAVITEKRLSHAEKASRLQSIYRACRVEIQQGRPDIESQARLFMDIAIRDLENSKRELINKGFSLTEIRNEFRSTEHLLNAVLEEALKNVGKTSVNDRMIEAQLLDLNGSRIRNIFEGRDKLATLVQHMSHNLQELLQEATRDVALKVLDRLQNYCAQVSRNLDVVLNKLSKQRENKEGWAVAYREYTLDTGYPLHLMALSTREQIQSYMEKVSIFTARSRIRASSLPESESERDELVDFRKWLGERTEFAVLFDGDVERLADVVTRYVEEKIHREAEKYKLVDILLQMDEKAMLQLLSEAMSRASSLVSYDPDFSPNRYESWLVIADYSNDEQARKNLVEAIGKTGSWNRVQLLSSNNPSEIAIFYYVDGLPMSAINDLRGRCLNAFLDRRQHWNRQQTSLNSGGLASSTGALNRRVGVPVYSGKDAEMRVLEKGIIHRLYAVKNAEVGSYSQVDIPELRDNEWETLQQVVRQTLIQHGIVESSSFSHISDKDVELLFNRYIHEHPNIDLEYQGNTHSLRLSSRIATLVGSVYNLLEPIVLGIQDGTLGKDHKTFEVQLEDFFQVYSSSTGINMICKHLSKDFATIFIDTETMFDNIRVPNPMLALISPHCELSLRTIEYLRYLLLTKKNSAETQIVILILFCKGFDLEAIKLLKTFSATYGRDIVLLNHEDLMEVVAAKEPLVALRYLILSQVSLTAVHPFVTEGPTPPHFFFGREPQLREISDRIATKSYVLIGGRRIGKTSILNRLLYTQLRERFLPFLFSCQSIDKQEPTKADFLAASSRSWQIEDASDHISSVADIVRALSGDKPLVFLIDEADRLVPTDSLAGWPLFGEMRSLAEEGHCQFVLAGEYGLGEAMNDPGSPFHNFAAKLPIGRLDGLAVNELVTYPLAQLGIELINQEAIVERIYEFTSGHPNIVQRLCQRLINVLDQSQRRQITVDDVENIIALREFQQDDFLSTFWERATTLERIISLLVARNSERIYTLRDIRQMLSDCLNLTPSALEVDKALRRLVELRNILALTSQGYTLAVEAFPLVVANAITVEDLLEVLLEVYSKSGDSIP